MKMPFLQLTFVKTMSLCIFKGQYLVFFIALLSQAFAVPVSALTWREVTETCPLTGETFTRQAVNSYTRMGMQLDLKPVGALVAPVPPPVCPDSGFVMYREDFSEADIAYFRKLVATPEFRDIRAGNTDYFVAAYQAEKRGADRLDVAFLMLQATWEADTEPARYDRYARIAMTRFEDYDRSGDAERLSETWWTVKLLIVNFRRRLGQFDAAADLLAELPLAGQPADSGIRMVMERLGRLISERKASAAEIAPRQP